MKHLGFILNLVALAVFIPGIYLPMFSLSMEVSAQAASAQLTTQAIDKELSLITTIQELWQDDRLLVAILIFLFSIAIPLIKTTIITIVYFIKDRLKAQRLASFVTVIGKWSMADVFVVAIFLAVLSTNHAENASHEQIALFGLKLNLMISSSTLSNIGVGFYYFTGYCLLSLLGSQISYAALKKR